MKALVSILLVGVGYIILRFVVNLTHSKFKYMKMTPEEKEKYNKSNSDVSLFSYVAGSDSSGDGCDTGGGSGGSGSCD